MLPEHFLIEHHFRDFDEFGHAAQAWNLYISQLEKGRFKGDLLQFGTGKVQVSNASFYPGTYQTGEPPKGLRTFGLMSDPASYLIWRRKKVAANQLMVFPPGSELDAVSARGRLGVFTLSFSEELLTEISRVLGYQDFEHLLNSQEMISGNQKVITELRHYLHQTCRFLQENPEKLKTPAIKCELEYELPTKLLKVISISRAKPPISNLKKRDKAMRRIEAYLAEFPKKYHTVGDLCNVSEISERTLEYAFQDRFGMSPKTFLIAMRLNGVRRELKNTDEQSPIKNLAGRWGFWHMSQFAVDYRRMFGELPSTTRKKSNNSE